MGIPFVVNVTLPDDKRGYVHRIGRVGRAERMGLAISLVSKVKEKVQLLSSVTSLFYKEFACYTVQPFLLSNVSSIEDDVFSKT